MTCEGLGEMFEGDSVDTCARTPIGMSENYINIQYSKIFPRKYPSIVSPITARLHLVSKIFLKMASLARVLVLPGVLGSAWLISLILGHILSSHWLCTVGCMP